MNNLTDIIYPECHLDSPIVTGKLIELVLYADLPINQPIEDKTLVQNIQINKLKRKKTPLINSQMQFREEAIRRKIDIRKINHIPYPNGNEELFHMVDQGLTQKLSQLIRLSHVTYSKICRRLVKLQELVEDRLGQSNKYKTPTEGNEYNKKSIIQLHLKFEGSLWFNPFLFWFTLKTDLRDLIKNAPKQALPSQTNTIYYNLRKYTILMNQNLVMIINKENYKTHYLTVEMVLMMSDVLEGRLMIDVGMRSDYRYSVFQNHGHALWKLIDSFFIDLGNQTYNVVALIEPLTLGYLQLNDKSPILKGAFLKYVLDELVTEFQNNGFTDEQELRLIVKSINQIFNIKDVHMIAEFFSFFRTFGHPTLEAQNAAKKVREHMNKPKVIHFQTMMKGHALFCGFIINGFRERHGGSWPPLTLPEHCSKTILNAYHNNESLTHEMCILEWKSFVGIHFKCFMPLTLDDDLTMFMKDKALAAVKSEWDSVYPRESMIYSPPNQTTSRRLVEVFLNDDDFDPAKLINYVISGDYIEDPEFNLSYSLKEKEIKQVGRLFAKMTYKMRACQVVAESLIANGVGKYFKENGMAKDEHELLKTLHKISVSSVPRDNKIDHKSTPTGRNINSKQIRKDGIKSHQLNRTNNRTPSEFGNLPEDTNDIQYETISTFLTTDLQKFCLNWRQESSNTFAERLNEIYGLPGFFNWMHKRLEKSVLYVADPYCPPYNKEHIDLDQVENDQIFIKYPMGGIEGYCQKLWTIITIPFLFLSAYEVGCKIAAVVQGDNQAIGITRRVHPNLPFKVKKIRSTELAQRYFNRLRHNMAAIGHNLKANETIVSTHFFVYSKRIYYDGLVLSQALKPLSRVVFWSETLVDETRSACSNICTAIAKSIEQGYSRWIGYALSIIKTLQQLIISLKFTINPHMTEDIVGPLVSNQNWLLCASLIPSQLGGFNYMNICRLYVRNIGDPVTASIADVKRLIEVNLLPESVLHKIMHQDAGNSHFLDWASDPYSINIPESQSVTVMLKNITARTVLQESVNPMLTGLFHFDFESEDRDLAQFLLDRPIILPRAAHEIMDNSLTGARQEIAGMLDTTKGLIRNSIMMGGIRPRLVDKLSYYDYNQFRIFNNLMNVKTKNSLIDSSACSVHLAINLRKRMWVHLTHGRPIYGLEVPDSIEVVKGFTINNCEDCYYCSTDSKEYCWFFVPRGCELDTVSHESNLMRVPYFGSTTDERSEIKLSNIRSPSRALKAAIRIATVYTWAFGDTDESWEEAWYLSSFRANVTIDELKAITPISTSNNIAHRLRDKSTQMKYSGNALNRVSRYTVISNDNMNFTIEGNKVDTNIVYQQVMLLGLSSLEDIFRYQSDTSNNNTLLHLHINVNCCVVEMNDHPFIESDHILPILQRVECNKLIYDDNPIIEIDQVKIHQQLYRSRSLDFPSWDFDQLKTGLAQSLSQTIIEIITRENKDHLNEFKVLSNDDDINSLITEFLLVDPEELVIYLGLSIAINWSFDIYYRRPEGKSQMTEFLSTIMISSSKHNLNVVANAFSHPGVFQKFWDSGLVEPVYGPNLATQDFYQISRDFLITCYQTYLNYWLSGNILEYMMTESDDEIVDQRFEINQARHLATLCCLYLDRRSMPMIRGMTSIEKCSVLTNALESNKYANPCGQDWNLEMLPVSVYPASLTYIRRGTIKHIKLRQYLTSESIGYERLLSNRAQPKLFELMDSVIPHGELDSVFFPISSIMSDDFREFNIRIDNFNCSNRWESHVFRRIGMNSTSCYKAVEIANFLKPRIDDCKNRLFLGEGSGSMMASYYFTLGECVNHFNTGISEDSAIGQRILHLQPAEYHLVAKNNPDDNEMLHNLDVLFNGKPESTWIGSVHSFKYIMNSLSAHSIDLIHNDMESSHSKDDMTILIEQCHSLALAINLGNETSHYVVKLAPRYEDYTNRLVYLYLKCYMNVFCFIPSYSNPYSSEVYMIMSNKRARGMVLPDDLVNDALKSNIWSEISISDIIINLKLKRDQTRKKEGKYNRDYSKSKLTSLTQVEKHMISCGFRLNGPKNVKKLCGHDISSGEDNLKAAINLQLNHILNFFDNTRESSSFFDPYPLEEQSKIRESFKTLAYKFYVYYLVYGLIKYDTIRTRYINNLRRKMLVLDLTSVVVRSVVQNYLIKRLDNLGFKKVWTFHINTQEIKVWWKVVGYSLLLSENNSK